MEHSYKILTDELRRLNQSVKESDWKKRQESLKEIVDKIRDINRVLKHLDSIRQTNRIN